MNSRECSRHFISRSVSWVCAALLTGTSALAQNPPNEPPVNFGKQPVKQTAWLLPPVTHDQFIQQTGQEAQPGKEGIPGKDQGPKKDFDPLAKPLPAPALEPGEEGLVINLPSALRLGNVRAWD